MDKRQFILFPKDREKHFPRQVLREIRLLQHLLCSKLSCQEKDACDAIKR